MIYWAMLEQGDWDTMRPLFSWWRSTLKLAVARTKAYAAGNPAEFGNSSGAFWPETSWIFGTYEPIDYCLKFGSKLRGTAAGYCAPTPVVGHVGSKYARAYWTNGPEVSVMMLRYFSYTQDMAFARDEMLPVLDAVLEFWFSHFPIVDGRLFLLNDRCDEAIVCNNSVTDVAALTSLVHEMRTLPRSLVTVARDQQLAQMQAQLPHLPMNANRTRLMPGDGPCHEVEQTTPNQDSGVQESYTVWPMELTGVNRSRPFLPIGVALETARAVTPKGTNMRFYPAGAAVLGLADDAVQMLRGFFATHNTTYQEMKRCCCGVYGQPSIFPAFWSSDDGTPCAERGGMVRTGINKMLVQSDSEGRRIMLLPAWPATWSCTFRLKVPLQTTVTGRIENGTLTQLSVMPPARRADVTIVSGQPLPPQKHDDEEEVTTIFLEAENFTIDASCWKVGHWIKSENYYSATFAGGYLSRGAFLGAPAVLPDGVSACVASQTVNITVTGTYALLLRYELQGPRYTTYFTVEIVQDSKIVFSKEYGYKACRLSTQCEVPGPAPVWEVDKLGQPSHSASTWADWLNTMSLRAGPATVRLVAKGASTADLAAGLRSANRNVDLVVLSSDLQEVTNRLVHPAKEINLALDGWLTQKDDVFIRFINHPTSTIASLSVPFSVEHSSYWTHYRNDSCVDNSTTCIIVHEAKPGSTSTWHEVGSLLDVLNQGEWGLQIIPQDAAMRHTLNYTLEVAVSASTMGKMEVIGSFDQQACVGWKEPAQEWDLLPLTQPLGCMLWLAYDANTIATKHIRLVESELFGIMERLEKHVSGGGLAPKGRPPALTIVTCTDCYPNLSDVASPKYNESATRFRQLFGISNQPTCPQPHCGPSDQDCCLSAMTKLKPDYLDIRGVAGPQCSTCFNGIFANASHVHEFFRGSIYANDTKAAQGVAIVSLGDEVSIPSCSSNVAQATAAFISWAQTKGLSPATVGCGNVSWARSNCTWSTSEGTNVRLFYYSSIFEQDHSIDQMKVFSDAVNVYLPNAGVGANFEPGDLCSHTWKWVKLFREGGFTLPWAEGYLFNVLNSVGTQQMNMIRQDMFKAGTRLYNTTKTDVGSFRGKTLYYIMSHYPGQNPDNWRRLFYTAISHGVKVIDLYEFHSTWRGTENYVLPDGGSYETVLSAMWELGSFEDIMQSGSEPSPERASRVGIVFSTTSDVWMSWHCEEFYWPQAQSFHSNKRALYMALKHLQYSVDVLLEPDDLADLSSEYFTIYLTDAHITAASAVALTQWVQGGGTVYATAGAGTRDEFDGKNTAMLQLLGLESVVVYAPANASVRFIKEDLPYVPPINVIMPSTEMKIAPFSAYGAVANLKVLPDSGVETVATFQNGGDIALSYRRVGDGAAVMAAFMPGLSYFAPAVPARPLDRCSRKECFTHFIPTNFSQAAAAMIALPESKAATKMVPRAAASENLVEVAILASDVGTMLPMVNWQETTAIDLQITVSNVSGWLAPFTSAILASTSKEVAWNPHDGETIVFNVPNLRVADALVLRAKSDDNELNTSCAASDANLLLLRQTLCQSIGSFAGYPECKLPNNLTAVGDWPNQAVYMCDLLAAMVAPTTCLNTTEAKTTVDMLAIVEPGKSPWWSTWVQFQVQYFDMPRKPHDRIESPATLGRKCWAFGYLRQTWVDGLRDALEKSMTVHDLDLNQFSAAWDKAVALTMPLCNRVMANCFLNLSYSVTRNGTCSQQIEQFVVGFTFENEGGGRNDSTGAAAASCPATGGCNARTPVSFPFPMYSTVEAFVEKYDVLRLSMDTLFNFIL
jgi:hypothetical protein